MILSANLKDSMPVINLIPMFLFIFCTMNMGRAFTTLSINPSPKYSLTQTKLEMLPPPFILKGIIGRLRRKRKVEDQNKLIEVGDILPLQTDVEVSLVTTSNVEDENDDTMVVSTTAASIEEIINIANDKKVLVFGMPGAFTPTCTKEHLPGIIQNQDVFYNKLGFDKILVVTTNDKFVNEEWGRQLGLFTTDNDRLVLVSDADGAFIRSLGLMEDMGFGMSTRSKRFAIVFKGKEKDDKVEAVVKNVFVDEGMDDCTTTSAENIIQVLSPKKQDIKDNKDKYNSVAYPLIGAAALSLGILILPLFGGVDDNKATVSSLDAPQGTSTRVLKGKRVKSSDGTIDKMRQILDEYNSENQ